MSLENKDLWLNILYLIAIVAGLVSLVLSFTGLFGTYDTEPILAIGLLTMALAGFLSNRD
jgi:hypothetical protein